MSDDRQQPPAGDPPPSEPAPLEAGDARPPSNGRPTVNRLRLAFVLAPLALLALVSTFFGMMMAVASDLPALENRQEYRHARNSRLLDRYGKPLGVLTDKENRILVRADQISAAMKHAIIAIEDRRFFDNEGIDLRAIARAAIADVTRGRAVQGASTITQQFVKNALAAQGNRTVFQKLREAALAYHLTRKWDKQKILTQYLNTVYFGNGAYGIESAARTYFGSRHPGCGTAQFGPCAAQLVPAEAALIAGLVASPSAYDPIAHPLAARHRRNLVLDRMVEQGYITSAERTEAAVQALPTAIDIQLPREETVAPYFTSWVKQQIVERFGAQRSFNGGLTIRTTLDLDLQRAAEQAIQSRLPNPAGPRAALVAIDNRTGEVRAMVGGDDYDSRPFNLATQGRRQPGSAFKPFVLAEALSQGIAPNSLWQSRQKEFTVPNSAGKEKFVVRNYEGAYSGVTTLARATTFSDNSVFAEVGIKVGVGRIASLARAMGIRTPVSSNYALTLGGLRQGVTPLDMAHAYETLAEHGRLIGGSLAPGFAPVGVREVREPGVAQPVVNHVEQRPVLSRNVADEVTSILQSVVSAGTGRAAATGEFAAGKTGTTENYGDAWFVGYSERYTVAVWVGYPDRLKSMKTDYFGEPVAGGTFPAEIWHDFVAAAQSIDAARAAAREAGKQGTTASQPATPAPAPAQGASGSSGPAGTAPQGAGTQQAPGQGQQQPAQPAPPPAPAPNGEGTGGLSAPPASGQ